MENFRSSSSYNTTVDSTVSRTGSTSDLYSMATNTIGLPPGVTHGTAPSSSQSPIFFDQMGNQLSISSSVLNGALMPPPQVDQQSSLDDRNRQNIPHDYALRRGENFIEKSSDDGSQSTCESVEDLTSDDEVCLFINLLGGWSTWTRSEILTREPRKKRPGKPFPTCWHG